MILFTKIFEILERTTDVASVGKHATRPIFNFNPSLFEKCLDYFEIGSVLNCRLKCHSFTFCCFLLLFCYCDLLNCRLLILAGRKVESVTYYAKYHKWDTFHFCILQLFFPLQLVIQFVEFLGRRYSARYAGSVSFLCAHSDGLEKLICCLVWWLVI